MTIGFLVGCLGAAIAAGVDILFEQMAPGLTWIRSTAVLIGWFVMVCGALTMAAGILMNWFLMWTRDEE